MPRTQLAPYSVIVHENMKPDNKRPLQGSSSLGLAEWIHHTLSANAKLHTVNTKDELSYHLDALPPVVVKDKGKSAWVAGRLWYGDFGLGGVLRDTTSNKAVHTKTPKEADQTPRDYLFGFNEAVSEGYLMLSHYGRMGGFSQIRAMLLAAFAADGNFDGLTLKIEPITIEEVYKEYARRVEASEIKFIFDAPSSVEDEFSYASQAPDEKKKPKRRQQRKASLVVSVKSKPWWRMKLTKDWSTKSSDLITIAKNIGNHLNIPEINNRIEVVTEHNKRKRTVVVGTEENHRTYIDISDAVALQSDGFPRHADVIAEAEKEIIDQF